MAPRPEVAVLAVAGVVVVTFLANAALVAYAWSMRDANRPGPPTDDADTVRCPDCGASNDSDYRFCRECVAELPGGTPAASVDASASGRTSR